MNRDPESTVAGVAHAAPLALQTRRVSWQAVFAGVVVALALQVLFAMLGTGIGASTIDPVAADGSPSASAFGTGAAVWWGVSSLIALFAAGWVSGRLSGAPRAGDGGWHGVIAWALSVLAIVWLVSSAAGTVLRSAGGVLGTVATATATGAAAVAPGIADAAKEQLDRSGISLDGIKREAQQLLAQTGKPALQPGAVADAASAAAADAQATAASAVATGDADLGALLDRLLARGRDAASQVDRDAVVNVVMARTGVSREEATRRVQGWETTASQLRAKAEQTAADAKQKAREAADATAKAVSQAMLLAFVALAIGGLVAWWGGSLGQRRGAIAWRDA
jgi:hypothetical protein